MKADPAKLEELKAYNRAYWKKNHVPKPRQKKILTPEQIEQRKEARREACRRYYYAHHPKAVPRTKPTPEELERRKQHKLAYYKAWRDRNRDRVREYSRKSRKRRWDAATPEQKKAHYRTAVQWQAENRQHYRDYQREYHRQWYLKNKGKQKAYDLAWRAKKKAESMTQGTSGGQHDL
jgi:hypothetical protein